MDIIIAGAGTVGFRLATTLSIRHNVTVIDNNADALNLLQESIDILPVIGNAEDPLTYRSLLDKEVDLFIAITDSDETNIISCLIVDEGLKVKDKIIRLRNTFFAKSSIPERLGNTIAVFPVMRTANAVRPLIEYPKARSVKKLNKSHLRLVSIRMQHGDIDNTDNIRIETVTSDKVIVVGIERERTFFIPSDDEILMPGDLIYFFGDLKEVEAVSSRIDAKMPKKIRKVVIYGASPLGIEIAKSLSRPDVAIKVLEEDLQRCHIASETLQGDATVINSHYGDQRLIEEEGLKDADMLIATSKNDEENIVRCIEAKEYGIEKVVAINNDMQHYALMHKLGLVVVRGAKNNAYYSIIEKIGSSSIVNSRLFCGGSAVTLTRTIYPNSRLIGKSVSPFRKGACLSILIRGGEMTRFDAPFIIQEGDDIMAFTTADGQEKVRRWIYDL